MNILAAIPARLQSSRFPEKILQKLGGIPVLQRVLHRVQLSGVFSHVVALVDDVRVQQLVREWGFEALMTDTKCNSGTERIVSILPKLPGDFIVNIQGDEPFISIDLLQDLGKTIAQNPSNEMLTAVYQITDTEILHNPNRVKVVLDHHHQALYFSRSCIPVVRDIADSQYWLSDYVYWGHIGIYAYRRNLLERFDSLQTSMLENAERLEQLRFLENGIRILCVEATEPSIGIDVPEDLQNAEQFLINHPEMK